MIKGSLNSLFLILSKIIENKNFLIVDDVITTGATVRECGKVLLGYGASNVYACSAVIAE